jgi:hypothetical protein
MKNKTVMIVFSKNRALQLDLCLNSFYNCCLDNLKTIDIKIIYKVDIRHQNSYSDVQFEHMHNDFISETYFKNDVIDSLIDYRDVLFACDDTIFVNSFKLKDIIKALDSNPSALGFSFRLGENTQYCYPLDALQVVPKFEKVNSQFRMFNWYSSTYDFRYPLELSSSLYKVYDLLNIMTSNTFSNPNDLESLLYFYISKFIEKKPNLLCFPQSVAFASPNNRIQSVALANRFGNQHAYSPEQLLSMYESGYRVDPAKFYGMVSNAAHMEVELI